VPNGGTVGAPHARPLTNTRPLRRKAPGARRARDTDRVLAAHRTIPLRDGNAIPQLGFGVYQIPPGQTTRTAVGAALTAGYRHVDTAAVYRNEADVGAAIRESGLAPGSVWVTTKLANRDQGAATARRAFEASLERLGFDAVDLYLLHWPHERRVESWRVLEQLHGEGLARSIGVSNFLVRHLDELLAIASVPPAVNQIELSPFLYRSRDDTLRRCAEEGIAVEAYSPLTKGRRLDDATVARIAAAVGRTPAQVLIRWSMQKGFIVIPRSSNPGRIAENAAVFDFGLDDSQMGALDALEAGLTTGWDPARQR
jgi:diketogulonate reductase-like aldo/keto reductase